VHALYHAVLHIVLLSVLGMLIFYGLLSHQVVGKVCIYYPSLCAVVLWRVVVVVVIIIIIALVFCYMILVSVFT
jgi:hypothetical protein